MQNFLTRFRIPTLLGLGIIAAGIAVGAFLVLKQQNIISQAYPDVSAQNITIANLSDDSVAISWQTSDAVPSFITFGSQNSNETTILDNRDTDPASINGGPTSRLLHYVTIKNLLPKTTYQYKIISGTSSSETLNFTTAAPLNFQTGLKPIIGSVLYRNEPLDEGIVYLEIADAAIQSSLIKNTGNFLIPMSQIRKLDLSEGFSPMKDTVAKLTVLSNKGQSTVLFKLEDFEKELPAIKLGENLDLISLKQNLTTYDLNGDGGVNSADYAIVFQNLGPLRETNPNRKQVGKNPKADLNEDGVVDQEDLDLIAKQINQ